MDVPQANSSSSPLVPALPTVIVHGAGLIAEEPVIETTQPPIVLLPPTQRRRIVEGIVLFLCSILFLRTMALEPFGVPTGSMAPTLVGNHKTVSCSRCQYLATIGEPNNKANGYPPLFCPNCNMADLLLDKAKEVAGDRLLVDKTVYRIRNPRRWEVAVFICPSDKSKPYVKRVIGLPTEQVQLKDGDVWINGELLRKTLTQAKECLIPVYNGDFFPPQGWERRWLPTDRVPRLKPVEDPFPEWYGYFGNEVIVHGENAVTPRMVAYWHVNADTGETNIIRDAFEYNGHGVGTQQFAVHDFHFSTVVEPTSGNGVLILHMYDGLDEVTAHIATGGEFGESKLLIPEKGMIRSCNKAPLKIGEKATIEISMIDRRASVAVNGQEYFSYDLPAGVKREDVSSPVKVGSQGVNVAFRKLTLSRDIYYRPGGAHGNTKPLTLGADEYFMLGDNTANSDDSRTWAIPAVPQKNFLGKPFLLHQPSRPSVWSIGGRQVEMQSIDWGRIRWMR